ncbi:hypothetical protein SESBI_13182 [Sesbania bispinosa]|nr:hypothetical protein SESBI_13182 [Sesbania bispinosa]
MPGTANGAWHRFRRSEDETFRLSGFQIQKVKGVDDLLIKLHGESTQNRVIIWRRWLFHFK